MRSTTAKSLLIVGITFLIWLVGFISHGYFHVSRLNGQCCGYEGHPGFLAMLFLINPGIYYFAGLTVILGLELLILRSLRKPE